MKRIQFKRIKKGKYKYEVTATYCVLAPIRPEKDIVTEFFTLTVDGWLMLKIGYRWNGDDFVFDCKNSMEASAEHDVFCQLIEMGLLDIGWRHLMNQQYRRTCLKYGMVPWRAKLRLFGLKTYWGIKAFFKGPKTL